MIGPGVGPSFYSGVPLPFPGATFGSDFTTNQYQISGAVYGVPSSIPGWTFTRASTGYAETVAGTLTSFASGAPRITDKGLLVEEARTNLLLRSQEFDDASWTKDATTVTANALAAPDGTTTADALYETTATSAHQARQTTSSLSSGTAYTCTFYAKAGTRTIVSQGIDGLNAWFNLGTGAVGTVEAGLTASIQAMGGGWYRCTTNRTPAVTAAKSFGIYACTTNGAVSYTGDATSPALYIWGAQLEAGSFSTSYIPTTTASATRAADFAAISGVSVSAGFTLISRAIRTGATTTGGVVVLGDSTSANRALIYASSLTGITGLVSASGSGTTAAQGTIVSGTAFGSGISFDGVTTARYSSQGGGPATITKALVPATITTLGLGGTTGGAAVELLNGYLQRAIIYPTAFTDAQLQAATA